MDRITTVLLNQNGLNDILLQAKRLDSYQPVERGRTYLSMTRERLPDLSSYEVSLSGISATYKAPGAPSDQLLELFWNTATTFIPRICCDVPQQGKRYNPERRKDVWMTMGYGRFGKGQPTHFGLGIGGVSPGDVDLVFRRDLFHTFIGLIGLQNDINVSMGENGALQIDVSGTKVRREQNVERFEWRANRDPLLLALQGGKGTIDADFRHLMVRGFRPSRFTDVVASLLEHHLNRADSLLLTG